MLEAKSGPAPYRRQPLRRTESGIPVFSETSEYIRNYDDISSRHLKSLEETGVNPFMSETTWSTLDQSTLDIMNRFVRPGDVLLDAGVGLGGLLSGFTENSRYGVDISLDYLELTRQKGIDVCMAMLEDLPYEDEAFDVVISTDVLEHVLDFYGATREMVRVLKPGGYLLARVPFEEDMKTYYDYREFKFVHVRRFDLWSLRLHFERVLGLDYVEHAMVLPTYRGLQPCRMKIAENAAEVRGILDELPDDLPGIPQMRAFTELSEQNFLDLMNQVSIRFPEHFQRLCDQVAGFLEINILFRKKA